MSAVPPVALPPGAKRLRNGATFEKNDTPSVLVVEPTLIAEEMHPGAEIAETKPSLPEAMAVATPTARS